MEPNIKEQNLHLTTAASIAHDTIHAIEIVKSFNAQAFEAERYAKIIAVAGRCYHRIAKANGLQIGFLRFMTHCIFVQGFWYGSYLVHAHGRNSGTVLTTFWAFITAIEAVEGIMPQFVVLKKGIVAAASLGDLTYGQHQSSMNRNKTSISPSNMLKDIELRGISFQYPSRPEVNALRNASCVFPGGQLSFVIGASGSGKTTLAQLLTCLYAPDEGTIRLGQLNLQELNIDSVRQCILLVDQQSSLFSGSIKDNIRMGLPTGRSQSAVNDAVAFSMLKSAVSDLSLGLATHVGPEGHSLSGGQRQRVALARAHIRDPSILILDEVTNALDIASRSLILAAIRVWRQGKTTIIITHDAAQILPGDQVIALHEGQVVAQGLRSYLESASSSTNVFAALASSKNTTIQTRGKARRKPAIEFKYSGRDIWEQHSSRPRYVRAARSNGAMNYSKAPPISAIFGSPFSANLDSALPMGGIPDHGPSSTSSTSPTSSSDSKSALWKLSTHVSRRFEKLSRGRDAESSALRASNCTTWAMFVQPAEQTTQASHQRQVSPTTPRDQKGPTTTDHCPSVLRIVFFAWKQLPRKEKFYCLAGLFCAIAHAVCTPVFAWIFSKLLGTITNALESSASAWRWSVAIFLLAIVDGIACFFFHALLEYCGQRWIEEMRAEALRKVLNRPRIFFSKEENTASSLSQTLDHSAEEMRNLFGRFALLTVVAFALSGIAICWSFLVSWRLTLVGLSVSPVIFLFAKLFNLVSSRLENQSNTAALTVSEVFSETIAGIKTTKLLSLEGIFRSKHVSATEQTFAVGIKRGLFSGIAYGLSESTSIFFAALITYYSGVLVSSSQCSVEDALLVLSMLLFALVSIGAIISYLPQMNASKDAAHRILRLTTLPDASHESTGCMRPAFVENISFKDVSFAYPSRPDDRVFSNLHLQFNNGTSTALVGPSGCGKSTIGALLLRFYGLGEFDMTNVNKGRILINGRDIHWIRTAALRELVILVPQTPILFSGTISDNITYGLLKQRRSRRAEIVAAAEGAGIAEWINSLTEGYETQLSNRGSDVSGGQAQRIAIARALIRQPNVLILDEPTSALDMESAAVVIDTLRSLILKRPDMIIIMITHSKQLMEACDRIVMLENGTVAEEGSYNALVSQQGPFSRLIAG